VELLLLLVVVVVELLLLLLQWWCGGLVLSGLRYRYTVLCPAPYTARLTYCCEGREGAKDVGGAGVEPWAELCGGQSSGGATAGGA
jgi:hypothetical protein